MQDVSKKLDFLDPQKTLPFWGSEVSIVSSLNDLQLKMEHGWWKSCYFPSSIFTAVLVHQNPFVIWSLGMNDYVFILKANFVCYPIKHICYSTGLGSLQRKIIYPQSLAL